MSSPVADGLERVRPYIVRFRTETDGGNETHGTGVIVAVSRPAGRVYIATAAHVVPRGQNAARTLVQVFREAKPDCVIEFDIRPGEVSPEVGFVYDNRSRADVGLLSLPTRPGTLKNFLDPNEVGAPVGGDNSVPAASTRIAWAGYPGLLRESAILGRPQLCYFEGSISAFVNDADRQVFIVDGHAMPGVSGAPVWWSNELNGRIEVFGVMSQYIGWSMPQEFHPHIQTSDSVERKRDRMPGVCFVQPIRGMVKYIEHMAIHGRPPDLASDNAGWP